MAGNSEGATRWFGAIIVCGAIGILLLVILLPISFSYLDFYHYGFLRRHTTGRVNLNRVYEGGRYLVGPDYQYEILPERKKAFSNTDPF